MRSLFVHATLGGVLLAQTAYADDARQITQEFQGHQTIEQVAAATAKVLESLEQQPGAASAGKASQEGLNAANIVFSDQDLDDVNQIMDGYQVIDNGLDLIGSGTEVSQSGTNITNYVTARMINNTAQYFSPDAAQWVHNTAGIDSHIGKVEQSGINAANMAFADFAIGSATQELAPGSLQKVRNIVEFEPNGSSDEINQSGINLGNILVSSKVDNVTRVFSGTQVVENTIHLNGNGTPTSVNQSGFNVANYVKADVVTWVKQHTEGGRQYVDNKVYDANGDEVTGASWLNQESVNIVNVMVIGGQSKQDTQDGTFYNGELYVEQTAAYPQTASGSGQQSQYGNVLAINR